MTTEQQIEQQIEPPLKLTLRMRLAARWYAFCRRVLLPPELRDGGKRIEAGADAIGKLWKNQQDLDAALIDSGRCQKSHKFWLEALIEVNGEHNTGRAKRIVQIYNAKVEGFEKELAAQEGKLGALTEGATRGEIKAQTPSARPTKPPPPGRPALAAVGGKG